MLPTHSLASATRYLLLVLPLLPSPAILAIEAILTTTTFVTGATLTKTTFVTGATLTKTTFVTGDILFTWATLSTRDLLSTGVTLIIAVTTLVTCANRACHIPLVILAIHIHDTFSTFYTFYIFYTFYTFYFKAGPLMPELLGHLLYILHVMCNILHVTCDI